jgi:UDP-N-acetyl-D-galactosamine dehydrogenase
MPERIVVVGLGYVGLPLAVALANNFKVQGFEINHQRVAELRNGHDRTGEVDGETIAASTLEVTVENAAIAGADIYIVTVPTPVDAQNQPDLSALRAACATVGGVMSKGAVVVFESTVYPGLTEEVCGPALADASGFESGRDFFLGYSPERINPGDKAHTIATITKVVAGQTPAVADRLEQVYATIVEAGIHRAPDIRTAEAAKVIENAQRDVNIAFVNEVAAICQRLNMSAHDVLAAAGTKWNFLSFTPGLVGGHCIGVDPYYLAYKAAEIGHVPEIILSGRRLNDAMGDMIAGWIDDRLSDPGRLLVLGLTFKEDVPDLRNSKVIDVVRGLTDRGHQVEVHDPMADRGEAQAIYGIDLAGPLNTLSGFDGVVGAVPHQSYRGFSSDDFERLAVPGGLIADIKGMWRELEMPATIRRWQL